MQQRAVMVDIARESAPCARFPKVPERNSPRHMDGFWRVSSYASADASVHRELDFAEQWEQQMVEDNRDQGQVVQEAIAEVRRRRDKVITEKNRVVAEGEKLNNKLSLAQRLMAGLRELRTISVLKRRYDTVFKVCFQRFVLQHFKRGFGVSPDSTTEGRSLDPRGAGRGRRTGRRARSLCSSGAGRRRTGRAGACWPKAPHAPRQGRKERRTLAPADGGGRLVAAAAGVGHLRPGHCRGENHGALTWRSTARSRTAGGWPFGMASGRSAMW